MLLKILSGDHVAMLECDGELVACKEFGLVQKTSHPVHLDQVLDVLLLIETLLSNSEFLMAI